MVGPEIRPAGFCTENGQAALVFRRSGSEFGRMGEFQTPDAIRRIGAPNIGPSPRIGARLVQIRALHVFVRAQLRLNRTRTRTSVRNRNPADRTIPFGCPPGTCPDRIPACTRFLRRFVAQK